ncbi:MAG: Inner membrane protein YhaI [Alphaproteobacteria bacterium MarineAlpha2_Bin1]|nr:MAG: Inner membrane protein YhaI [Alphaproteobacteria bacterium MarineAlpha2_Bin1]
MNFSQSVISVYSNYFVYKSRSPRSEYWWYTLFYLLVSFFLAILDYAFLLILPFFSALSILTNLFVILNIIPGIMLAIRRFHDLNRSGFWVLINLIPVIGVIIVFIWFCFKGTEGQNRFGENPLDSVK